MSKTNHRVHKDREAKLGESEAHKRRRGFTQKAMEFVETVDLNNEELLYSYLDDEEFEPVEKIRRRR